MRVISVKLIQGQKEIGESHSEKAGFQELDTKSGKFWKNSQILPPTHLTKLEKVAIIGKWQKDKLKSLFKSQKTVKRACTRKTGKLVR